MTSSMNGRSLAERKNGSAGLKVEPRGCDENIFKGSRTRVFWDTSDAILDLRLTDVAESQRRSI